MVKRVMDVVVHVRATWPLPEGYDLLYRLRNIVGKRRLPNSQYIGMKRDDRPTLVVNAQSSLLCG